MKRSAAYTKLEALLDKRIMLADGAMATFAKQSGLLSDGDCCDMLSLTRPESVSHIHRYYLAAGADIIMTNTFNANRISLARYGQGALAYELSRASALLARREADIFTQKTPARPRFVAGSVGPIVATGQLPAEDVVEPYSDAIEGLLDGGCDIILVESIMSVEIARSALVAVRIHEKQRGERVPIIMSATVDCAGRKLLSGETIEEFYAAFADEGLLAIGVNCSYGAQQMFSALEYLSSVSRIRVLAMPNAGLPNAGGGYDETPEIFASRMIRFMDAGFVNIVGGCCGTGPEHISKIAKAIEKYPPRPLT